MGKLAAIIVTLPLPCLPTGLFCFFYEPSWERPVEARFFQDICRSRSISKKEIDHETRKVSRCAVSPSSRPVGRRLGPGPVPALLPGGKHLLRPKEL